MVRSAERSTEERDDADRGTVGVAPSVVSLWGVLNVTPDSFSDGGRFDSLETALAHARRMRDEGADVIDVGGESSRPKGKDYGDGAEHVPMAEELERVMPVVEALVAEGITVSLDTVKAEVARAGLAAGARFVNDVSGGASRELLEAVADSDGQLVLMHNRGKGETESGNTHYSDVVATVAAELEQSVARARDAGVPEDRLWIDPGLGFAKTAAQSMELLTRTAELRARLGLPMLVGPSRKSFIARTAPNADGTLPSPSERESGTAVACALAVLGGCDALRVHDVGAMRQAALLAQAHRAATKEVRWTS